MPSIASCINKKTHSFNHCQNYKMSSKTWVDLPASKYGIEYVLANEGVNASLEQRVLQYNSKTIKHYFRRSSNKIWKRTSKISLFEIKMNDLDRVARRDGYKDGTAVMYIREIFEPGDVEYDYIGSYVCATQLSKEQLDRLKIMIVPKPREDILLAYLDYYNTANQQDHIFNESTDVVRHFEGFHRRYSDLGTDKKAKFDLLFSFTFAVKTYSGWIHKFESTRKRTTMIGSLARHWRKILGKYTAAELGMITTCLQMIDRSQHVGITYLTHKNLVVLCLYILQVLI